MFTNFKTDFIKCVQKCLTVLTVQYKLHKKGGYLKSLLSGLNHNSFKAPFIQYIKDSHIKYSEYGL